MTFDEFDFHKDLQKGIRVAGFKQPSPIQKEAIPIVLNRTDLVAQAHTGTGKTAAFGLPIMDMIAKGEVERALVITPTRELATQVSDELYHLGRFAGIRTLTVYGGVGYGRQIALIHKGVQIVVATPGRLRDLYKKGKIDTFNPEVVVLDEADEMLDMGFLDDIKEIFEYIPQNRQTLLFSATMPEPIKQLADSILYNPQFISSIGDQETTNNIIEQRYLIIREEQRDEALANLLEIEEFKKCLIFCRMKREVDRLTEHLQALGFMAKGLHGDMEQIDREAVVKSYRRAETRILVATDVAARGLDVKDVTHVFNYHIPLDPQSYVHRIGRTGRAGKSGQAITLVSTSEFRELERIQKEVGAEMRLETINACSVEYDENSIDKLYMALKNTPVSENIDNVLTRFSSMDQTEFIKKALSYMLDMTNNSDTGQIGYNQSDVAVMMKDFEQEQKVSQSNKKRKKRR